MRDRRPLAFVACALLTACSVAPIQPSPSASVPAPTFEATPTPVPTPAPVGPMDANGVPTLLEGEPVHRGADLAAVIAASRNATEFLAGGWFHAGAGVRYCAMFSGDFAVNDCPDLELYESRVGVEHVVLANSGRRFFELEGAATRAVVLTVHTHDKRCGADDPRCPSRVVVDAVAWLGELPADSPPPRPMSTPPPNGMTRDDAIALAMSLADRHTTPLTVRTAVAGPLWAVLPMWGRDSGQWVWVIVLDGHFVTPCIEPCSDEGDSELVVFDYVTGAMVGTMTPAGPPENLPVESAQP